MSILDKIRENTNFLKCKGQVPPSESVSEESTESPRDVFLRETGEWIKERRSGGVNCPCCGLFCKEWTKSIVSTAAAELCKLVSMYKGKPIHHDEFAIVEKDRNFSQLVLWGLVKAGENDDGAKRASGMWAPTELGINFVRGHTTIEKYVTTFDNKIVPNPSDKDGVCISIVDALQQKFSYEDLMGCNFPLVQV